MFYIHTNVHEFYINFFILFASALALFLVSPNAKNGFSIFFLSKAFFYFLFYHNLQIRAHPCYPWLNY